MSRRLVLLTCSGEYTSSKQEAVMKLPPRYVHNLYASALFRSAMDYLTIPEIDRNMANRLFRSLQVPVV